MATIYSLVLLSHPLILVHEETNTVQHTDSDMLLLPQKESLVLFFFVSFKKVKNIFLKNKLNSHTDDIPYTSLFLFFLFFYSFILFSFFKIEIKAHEIKTGKLSEEENKQSLRMPSELR